MSLDKIIITLYLALFVWQCMRHAQVQWLWGAVALWFGFGLLLAQHLPGIWGIGRWAGIYQPYFYISLASLFFFVTHWRWHRPSQRFYADPKCSPYLIYLAISGMLLHLAWLIVLLIGLWRYPNGVSSYVVLSLAQLYVLQPSYWIMIQWCLMAVLWAFQRQFVHTRLLCFSVQQLQAAFFSGLLAWMAYVVMDLSHYVR